MEFNYTSNFAKTSSKKRNKDNTGPDMKDIVANTKDVKKEEIPKWRRGLKKLDGQTKNETTGKWEGGGNLGGIGKVVGEYQELREKSMSGLSPTATYGDSGETKATLLSEEPIAYAAGLQQTLLRKEKKKKGSNYDIT
tara:strand:- start:43 stop:456 length:414 start_codon:yes stop_codon:yes gene_type:complete